MSDKLSPEARSANMARIRSRDTAPEMALRRALHAAGFRYRLHVKQLPGKPDIVLPRYGAVIQVRGCFWHGHSCPDGRLPKSRQEYWLPKLAGNRRRDRRNDRALRALGWRVITVWECKLSNPRSLNAQLNRIIRLLDGPPA